MNEEEIKEYKRQFPRKNKNIEICSCYISDLEEIRTFVNDLDDYIRRNADHKKDISLDNKDGDNEYSDRLTAIYSIRETEEEWEKRLIQKKKENEKSKNKYLANNLKLLTRNEEILNKIKAGVDINTIIHNLENN